jgi:hypothetical protein|tara:strand:+ start:152 stop:934 length:783 start_codon:yes stop_codon:yes gene_type:complete
MSWFLKNDILKILDATQEERDKLQNHIIYRSINNIDQLQTFMSNHVFAVWDFMSILKSLQSKLTCVSIPWIPSGKGTPARLINEIVIEEESDIDPHGQYMSHFEMYCYAMNQAGANTESIDVFLQNLKTSNVSKSLIISNAPTAARNFVTETFKILDAAQPHVIASMFTFGREEVIPEMFKNIVKEMDISLHGKLKLFRYYLDRHIGLDEDEHTPTALRMVKELCENNKDKWIEATTVAKKCMNARIKFWDEILEQIDKN